MVAVRWVASTASSVNGAEVVAATVAVVSALSWESVCTVAAVRPVRVGAVSLMMVVSGMGNSFSAAALTPVSLMINIITIAPTYGNRRNTSLLILDLIPGAT